MLLWPEAIKILNSNGFQEVPEAHLAKKIIMLFRQTDAKQLLDFYQSSDPFTRGRLIIAAGNIAGGITIRDLFVNGLDDKRFCEPELPELSGFPLRICDVAYNQLVLRYKIPGVLRTIVVFHSIQTRDYHIAKLRQLFR